jgi:putative DNA primase/helicase
VVKVYFEGQEDDPVHIDTLDMRNADEREEFVAAVAARATEFEHEDIARLVLKAASIEIPKPKGADIPRVDVMDAQDGPMPTVGPIESARAGKPWIQRDWGNGQRLAHHFGDILRFDLRTKHWRVWDGKRWKADENGTSIYHYAAETAKRIFEEAKTCAESEQHRHLAPELAKHAAKSLDKGKLDAMVAMASKQKIIAPPASAWDNNKFAFNCDNGTLDLTTKELKPHSASDLITCLSPVPYQEDAQSELLETVLNDWIGDPEIIAFLRRASGYCLTGDASEEKLFFVHGPTNSGKSTFMEMMKMVLADYARTANFESFLKKSSTNGGAASGDIARLVGARFVVSSETDDGKELAEGVVKNMTGGERITARNLYCPEFEYLPEFKLWLVANHAPHIDPDDAAMWRRIVRTPFDHTIPPEKRDRKVKRQLTDPKLSGPAILAWLVVGCMEWQEFGLEIPDSVKALTEELRDEMDTTADFFETRLHFGPSFTCSLAHIQQAYDKWAQEQCIPASRRMGAKKLAKKLQDRGARRERDASGCRYWSRVGVQPGALPYV